MAVLTQLGLAALAVPVYVILVSIYRLTLHPLAKYPGPLLWRLSSWPDGLTAKTGRRHRIHQQLHARYGHIVRIGPNKLSFDTQKAVHDIYTDRNANVHKSGFVGLTSQLTNAPHLQMLQDKKEHGQRRRLMAHAFSESALKSAEQYMLKPIRVWCDALLQGSAKATDGWSVVKDLGHWANLLTLDVLGELCFGQSFGATENGDHEVIPFMLEGIAFTHSIAYLPITWLFIPILRTQKLLKFLSPTAFARRWAFRLKLQGLVTQRRQAEIDAEASGTELRKDFFHHVLRARDPDTGAMLPTDSYLSEALLLVAAGTDTTSTALSACLFYLNRDLSKLKKLRSEVQAAFTSVEDIKNGPQLTSLRYLRACIDEAMRMTPPVPGTLTRVILPGGAIIDDQPLPTNTELDVPLFALMHNPEYYPEPFSFTPERWIPGSKTPHFEVTDDLITKQRAAFVPFSSGIRNCLGKNMAYMEMSIVLARLVFLFDMRFKDDTVPGGIDFETEDWFISTKEGPYLQFKLRDEKFREEMAQALRQDREVDEKAKLQMRSEKV